MVEPHRQTGFVVVAGSMIGAGSALGALSTSKSARGGPVVCQAACNLASTSGGVVMIVGIAFAFSRRPLST
jgi:hypothetical protein